MDMRYLMKHQSWLMITVLSWLTVLTLPILHATDDNQKKLLADTSNKETASELKESEMLLPLSSGGGLEEKRTSFMASRGKKEADVINQLDSNVPINDNNNQFDMKRASSFLPMRGRKDNYPQWFIPNEESYYDERKRAAWMPMRGRKNSDAINYVDPYGDVYQTELDAAKRASFMAMRGRKNSNYGLNGFGQGEYYVPTQQISTLSQVKIPNWMEGEPVISDNSELMDKRAKAFYGARGKRTASDSGDDKVFNGHDDSQKHNNGHNENFFATRG